MFIYPEVKKPNHFREFDNSNKESFLFNTIDEMVDIVFYNLINLESLSKKELEATVGSYLAQIPHIIYTSHKYIQNVLYEVDLNDLVLTINFEIHHYNKLAETHTIKKGIPRMPTEDSYSALFNEMGLNEDFLDVAVESAKIKINEFIKTL